MESVCNANEQMQAEHGISLLSWMLWLNGTVQISLTLNELFSWNIKDSFILNNMIFLHV